jgi:hypothetical protein
VLFSDKTVAEYINTHCEPSWKSLRPVPKVSIDFGNGVKVNRTLNGNIATFICTTDGTVVDVIAGMHTPENYSQRLQLAVKLASDLPADPTARRKKLTEYHKRESVREMTGIYANPMVKPDDITSWLYKEALHVDLDDPYLGLKPMLFATYPFNDEPNE